MNVFVLCTGRCGSTTFTKACAHISNYTAAHESRTGLLGPDRLAYPANHIEADNRLSWLLGRLDESYGDSAFYVHLKRDLQLTASSFVKRYDRGIMAAYRSPGILMDLPREAIPSEVAVDYCNTVNTNITLFLKDKTSKITIDLEAAKPGFIEFCRLIDANVNLHAALAEFDFQHNSS